MQIQVGWATNSDVSGKDRKEIIDRLRDVATSNLHQESKKSERVKLTKAQVMERLELIESNDLNTDLRDELARGIGLPFSGIPLVFEPKSPPQEADVNS